jgi:effector-binding domain-containing protein
MEQLTFHEIIEKITTKLTESDDETITYIYNQLFDNPIIYIGDDLWEEEFNEDSDIIIDNEDDDNEDDINAKQNKKNSRYNQYDDTDYDDDDN